MRAAVTIAIETCMRQGELADLRWERVNRRAPLPGLGQVASLFTSPEAAWEWLVAPNAMTGGRAPIDMLGGGDQAVEEVVRAAEGALDFN